MSDSTQQQQPPVRQAGYDVTGHTYERGNYSSRIARAYHRRRCETLQAGIEHRCASDRPLRILEIGCGTGMTLDFLAGLPASHELWGLDFSSTMLGHAQQKAEAASNSATLLLGNAMEIPFPAATFDVVYGTRFIHQFHHDAKKKIYAELERVSRPGALIALECYSRPYNHFRYLTDQRNKYDSREEYFSHYPSPEELRDLTGGHHEEVSLRFGFGRWINRIFGYKAYCAVNELAQSPPMSLLRDEYWCLAENSRPTPSSASDSPNPGGLGLLRCARCKGALGHAEAPPRLNCDPCQLEYAITDGIPNMLLHEATPSESPA